MTEIEKNQIENLNKVTQVTLEIKADDIKSTSYYKQDDCAITRAVKRAGYEGKDTGACVVIGETTFFCSNSNYMELSNKVIDAYERHEKGLDVEDFEFTLVLGKA